MFTFRRACCKLNAPHECVQYHTTTAVVLLYAICFCLRGFSTYEQRWRGLYLYVDPPRACVGWIMRCLPSVVRSPIFFPPMERGMIHIDSHRFVHTITIFEATERLTRLNTEMNDLHNQNSRHDHTASLCSGRGRRLP